MDVLDLYNKFIKGESVYIIDDSEAAAFVIGKQKCSENGNCNTVKMGTEIQ